MRMSSMLAAVVICAGSAITIFSDTRATSSQPVRQHAQTVAETDQPSASGKKRPVAAGTQIACTRLGCNPIPRGCRIEKEFSPDGTPTGFDLVVCPFR